MRRTLVGVLGCEDVIIGLPLDERLLPLDGHTDILLLLFSEVRDEELVSTLNGGHCEDRCKMRDWKSRRRISTPVRVFVYW